jgi:hypothetical protein
MESVGTLRSTAPRDILRSRSSLLDEGTPRADLVVDYVDGNELAGLNTSDKDDDMEDRLHGAEEPKPAGAVCFNARPACWYSSNTVLQLRRYAPPLIKAKYDLCYMPHSRPVFN